MSNRLVTALLLALAVLSTSVSATYFTSPTASTVWTNAAGEDITWKYQPGGAPNGDILLLGMSPTGTPITTTPLTVATDVDLTSESITFPDGLQLRTATRQYMLLMVDSSNHENVYSQVGPFEIQSFAAASSSSSSSSASSAASSSLSSASSASSSSEVTSSSSASSSSSSSRDPVTATVIETASSGVLITMTLQPSASSGGSGDAQTVTVTQSAASRAAASGASAGATSGAVATRFGASGLVAMGAAALVGAAFVL
ncbi:hypothetical protein RHOSPDRAFT_27650 [Rhodotorula sp. JG-1b]|nr:hypothetical protein RHOSPDRAFT_27650 [Rhodotorula sp. JG-1b]